jgi:YfiH family protein
MIKPIRPDWDAPRGVEALCTTRVGGISCSPYDNFNLGMHVGDDNEQVNRNRLLLRKNLELPDDPDWINQTHGTRAVTLEQDQNRDADAAITRQAGRIAVVMVADCLPILVASRDASEVAAIHAGWRGLQAGVIQTTLRDMHSQPESLSAWIGPAISQANFEVGGEVRDAFLQTNPIGAEFFIAHGPGHWLCDLGGIAALVLKQQGVGAISRDQHCTFQDKDLFYSYRREGITGRHAALIWIK